ncbi:non-ribosomal peptide synthetase [Kutzneria sp. 744]|nr:non-ribosomal peptide synthetase [Kutzneria sp. 744]
MARSAALVQQTGDSESRIVGYVEVAVRPEAADMLEFGPGLSTVELREFLARTLPDTLAPATFVIMDELPLGPDGTVDRAALPEPTTTAGDQGPADGRRTCARRALRDLLGVDRIGIDDDFFTMGGDSIRSIQLATRARARGVEIAPREIFELRTVAELAARVADKADQAVAAARPEDDGVGWMPLTPMGARLVEQKKIRRFSMFTIVDLPADIDEAGLLATLTAVVDRHDALRSRLVSGGLRVQPAGSVEVAPLLRRAGLGADLQRELDDAIGRLNPTKGVMAQFVWAEPDRLIIVAHHLVVDGVSWRILLPDLASAWQSVRAGRTPRLPAVPTSLRRWAHALLDEATTTGRMAELPLWESIVDGPDPVLGSRPLDAGVDVRATLDQLDVRLPASVADTLLAQLPVVYRCGIAEGLMAALALALTRWRRTRGVDESSVLLRVEGHGREEAVVPGADVSRTVGWFTSAFPVRVDIPDAERASAVDAAIKAVKQRLRAIPDKGLGYGLLRHLNDETRETLEQYPDGQVTFNYLGRFSVADTPRRLRGLGWTEVAEAADMVTEFDPDMAVLSAVEVNAYVAEDDSGPAVVARFGFPTGVLSRDEVGELVELWQTALAELAGRLTAPDAAGLTTSDVPLVAVHQGEIDAWQRNYPGLADIWPPTPLQSGPVVPVEAGRADLRRLPRAAGAPADRRGRPGPHARGRPGAAGPARQPAGRVRQRRARRVGAAGAGQGRPALAPGRPAGAGPGRPRSGAGPGAGRGPGRVLRSGRPAAGAHDAGADRPGRRRTGAHHPPRAAGRLVAAAAGAGPAQVVRIERRCLGAAGAPAVSRLPALAAGPGRGRHGRGLGERARRSA